MKLVYKTDTEILYSLRVIPPLSLFVETSVGNSRKMLGRFWEIYKQMLKGKKYSKWQIWYHVITSLLKPMPPTSLRGHSGVYFGSGKHECIEAALGKVSWFFFSLPHGVIQRKDFKEHIDPRNTVDVYFNKKLTLDGMMQGKAFAYGSIGRTYDLKAFFGFTDPDVSNVHDTEGCDICSEHATRVIRYAGVPLIPGLDASQVHPTHLYEYCESQEGEVDGWVKKWSWDGKNAYTY